MSCKANRQITSSLMVALCTLGSAGSAAAQNVISVPEQVTARIAEILPESNNAGAAFVSPVYSPNVIVDQACTIDAVFLWEGAGFRNAAGWFTFREEVSGGFTILDRNLIWANASMPNSGGAVPIGETRPLLDGSGQIRVFQPGEKVGFFIVANGFGQDDRIRNYDPLQTLFPSSDPAVNATIGRGLYTTLDRLNPEFPSGQADKARHVAMIDMPPVPMFMDGERYLMMGMEDLNRLGGSDDDFNDLVVVLSASPIEAISRTQAFRYEPDDPDGDGVRGTADSFPNDPDRAFLLRYPQNGMDFLALEDEYPAVGDADYNDAVVAHSFVVVSDATGRVKDVLGEFHLLARGSVHDHGFGIHFPQLPSSATGRFSIERFLSDASGTVQRVDYPDLYRLLVRDQRRLWVFESTIRALPGEAGTAFGNTLNSMPSKPAASARFHLEFEEPLPSEQVGNVPFDPFFDIHRGGLRDVHLPGREPFPDREPGLPDETGGSSFVDAAGYPFLLAVPETWQFPLEQIRIGVAFDRFDDWRTSSGSRSTSWHEFPGAVGSGLVGATLPQFIPVREWTVALPQP